MIDQDIWRSDIDFVGAKGLIYIGDKIIVYRRDTKTKNYPLQIDLPGGGREGNETLFETFKREVKEEFGIPISEGDIVFSKRYPSVEFEDRNAYFIVAKPRDVKEEDIVFGDEGLEYFLATPEAFAECSDGMAKQQKRVKDFLAEPK